LQENRIQSQVNVMGPVGSTVSPAGLPTFYWVKDGRFYYLRGDAKADEAPSSLALRPDFPPERALSLVTKAAEKN
ncbi:MAG TPA: hypothetical protein VGR00_02795, partial [Thermoanaerobaculia bacterium]|nr:hypothetical protein [Thermoanaerobaculia bacterium]